ncbi:mas-related G-protein coupled receptor member H-like [Heteronotia binoei]|uniref:mas-related G-protein coupled receptor member H-like n=1 Tax=Heteronotia binoei TaxID=13085 RepID=UPI00292E7FCC|nr:mas-related G-protein coupled receptor member H-like [Heteronotia binoei]
MYNNSSSGRPEQYLDVPYIISVLTSCICIIGLVGNGIVIYLLGFHIKRSPFTAYILNLAVADFGVLLFLCVISFLLLTHVSCFPKIVEIAVSCMYNTSQFLLTAISIHRCMSVLFPVWYRCHRPLHLSTVICVVIWVASFLISVILDPLGHLWEFEIYSYPFVAGVALCLPLVTVSTTILLFKIFCKSQQPRRGRLLTIIFLTLLFFLIFAFPLNAILTLIFFNSSKYAYLIIYGFVCACPNSCVNPVIYFMVGRKKRGQGWQGLKAILQRAFEVKEEHREESCTTAQVIAMTPSQ